MKNIFKYTQTSLLSIGVAMLLFACGAKTDKEKAIADKKAQIEQIKKERNALNDQIVKLEAELLKLEPKAKKSVTVSVQPVTAGTFTHLIDVHGKIESDRNVVVTALTAGSITNVYVKRGQSVRKGQVLALIDGEILNKSIEEVKTQLVLATDVYEKQKK